MPVWLTRLDQLARERKRAWFARGRRAIKQSRRKAMGRLERMQKTVTRRWSRSMHEAGRSLRPLARWAWRSRKVTRERGMNARLAAVNLSRKAGRRLWGMRAPFVRASHRMSKVNEQLQTYREEWALEREIEQAIAGDEPILFGPWTSEVGFEALYWVAFTRWVKLNYRLKSPRLAVMSRGGVASWYGDIADRYVEIFDHITPEDFARRGAERRVEAGTNKQVALSALDEELIAAARRQLGEPRLRVVHPSLMYRLFRRFWAGHRPIGFLESHAQHARLVLPPERPLHLPDEYVAVKFYAAQSLPETAENRRMVARLVDSLAERYPVVLLDTGLALDEHGDYALARGGRVTSVRDLMRPSDNLGVQTQIIAGARGFVGTCGSIAWLAPMLGVDTLAVMTDARFLHAHLHAARWVYKRLDAGRFSALDLGACGTFGLTVGSAPVAESAIAYGE